VKNTDLQIVEAAEKRLSKEILPLAQNGHGAMSKKAARKAALQFKPDDRDRRSAVAIKEVIPNAIHRFESRQSPK
jgi:hypothetical protein